MIHAAAPPSLCYQPTLVKVKPLSGPENRCLGDQVFDAPLPGSRIKEAEEGFGLLATPVHMRNWSLLVIGVPLEFRAKDLHKRLRAQCGNILDDEGSPIYNANEVFPLIWSEHPLPHCRSIPPFFHPELRPRVLHGRDL